ncbi:hypothetical protein MFM001_21520 [Mycobacterium sp. MFM001]|nr:hypothetical protein MFM001_21520 [Mycobacterium sp. MFM001]
MRAGCTLASELAEAEQMLHAEKKAGAADPADQNRDLHTGRQYAWRRDDPTRRRPNCGSAVKNWSRDGMEIFRIA